MNQIRIPEGMGLEDFTLGAMGFRKALKKAPHRRVHGAFRKKASPMALMKGKSKGRKTRSGGGDPEAEAAAPAYAAPVPAPVYAEPDTYAPPAQEATPDVIPTQTSSPSLGPSAPSAGPMMPPSAAPAASMPASAPPMPGLPQEVTAEPEGEAAKSSDGEASDDAPEAAPRGEEETAPEEEAEAAPEESDSEEDKSSPSEEPASAEGIGKFVIDPKAKRRLEPARPAWRSTHLDEAFERMKNDAYDRSKISGLSQISQTPQTSSGLPLFGLILGVGAVVGAIYYFNKVKKT